MRKTIIAAAVLMLIATGANAQNNRSGSTYRRNGSSSSVSAGTSATQGRGSASKAPQRHDSATAARPDRQSPGKTEATERPGGGAPRTGTAPNNNGRGSNSLTPRTENPTRGNMGVTGGRGPEAGNPTRGNMGVTGGRGPEAVNPPRGNMGAPGRRGPEAGNPPRGNMGVTGGRGPEAGNPPRGNMGAPSGRGPAQARRYDDRGRMAPPPVDPRHGPMIPHGPRINHVPGPGHPMIPRARHFSRNEIILRNNACTIDIYTDFWNKAEAAAFIREMLWNSYYEVETFSSSVITTRLTEIPTGFLSSTLFSMRFTLSRTPSGVRVTVTGRWMEPAGSLATLFFQPDDRYVTYYAWNSLEDIALSIPHSHIVYR